MQAKTHVKKVEQCVDVWPGEKEDAQSDGIHPCFSLQLHAGHHLAMHLWEEQRLWQAAEVLLQEAGAVNDVHAGWKGVSSIQQFLNVTMHENKLDSSKKIMKCT